MITIKERVDRIMSDMGYIAPEIKDEWLRNRLMLDIEYIIGEVIEATETAITNVVSEVIKVKR